MNKIILLLIFLMVLSSVSAYQLSHTDSDLLIYLGDNITSTHWEDSKNNAPFPKLNCTFDGNPTNGTPISPYGSSSVFFDGTGDWCASAEAVDEMAILNTSVGMTFAWFFKGIVGQDKRFLDMYGVDGGDIRGFYFSGNTDGGGSNIHTFAKDNGTNEIWSYSTPGETIFSDNIPYCIIMTVNGSDVVMYRNNTAVWTSPLVKNSTMGTPTIVTELIVGARYDDDFEIEGNFSNIAIFKRALNSSDRNAFCEDGFDISTGAAPPPPTGTENPTWAIPLNDDWNNNTNITMNITHTANVNYAVYLDDELYTNNLSQTGDFYLKFTTNLTDGSYSFKASAFNTTSGVWSNNVTRLWILDSVSPTITLLSENSFASDNSTKISSYLTNITLNISFFDTHLEGGQTLINITNSSNDSKFAAHNTTITGTTLNISQILDITGWSLGNYTVVLAAADSHTSLNIDNYDTIISSDYVEYVTTEGIIIKIETLESAININEITTTKLNDRYKFNFNFKDYKTTTTFRVTSSRKLDYLKDSDYNAHFVTTDGMKGNWIDFNSAGLKSENYKITKINDYTYDVTLLNINQKDFDFNSVGGLNIIEKHYRFELTSIVHVWSYNTATNLTISDYDVVINSVTESGTSTSPAIHTGISKGDYTITVDSTYFTSKDLNVTINENFHNFSVNLTEVNAIDDCSVFNDLILSFHGRDEETNDNVTMELDITIEHFFSENVTDIRNSSFSFRNLTQYDICTNINGTFIIDSIMQYGDGTIYTDRKYYINNLSINTTSPQNVFLYHLNNSKASEIVFTVFDTTTGDKISGAFIKILRFYPGENVFRTVEISKTDEVGETLGKMVLADVFYKFIIEAPAGTVKFTSDVLRILSLTRSFGISFVEDILDTWDKIHGVSTSVTCTKGTKTCRIIWSDTSNIVRDATLEVWRTTGLADALLSTQTTTAAAGTISYTIVEDTSGKAYTAKGFIESNTGTSLYGVGIAGLIFSDNPFFTDETHRLASLFPLFLLVVVIVFALIDWGVIGIVVGSLLGLIIGSIVGILPIDPFYLISFILMAIILIYKLSK